MMIANQPKLKSVIESAISASDLPEGWDSARLGRISTIVTGRKDVNEENPDGKYPFFTCARKIHRIDEYSFEGKAVLIAGNGFFNVKHYEGRFDAYQRTYVLQNFAINGRYVYWWIEHNLDTITKDNRGSTIRYIRLGDLTNHIVSFPPLIEQKRIVAKVEELLALVNAALERLAKVKEILKRFRQSVLAAACYGRLTADWSEKNPRVISAKEILDKMQRSRLEQAPTQAQKKKIKDIYSYQEREDSDILPENWEYVSLDKLCESFQYGTSKKSQASGKVPVLRMGNIQNGRIDWNDLVYTSDDEEIRKYGLNPGDVLFNRTNSPELVGKTCIYKGERHAIFAGYLIRINNFEELDSEYLNYCLNSIYAKEFCLRVKTDGVSQSNINAQKLGKFEVPFCSKEEQQEIVRLVEELFKLADAIEKRVADAATRAEKLTQAILVKAFRGELVQAEAELARQEGRSYELASVLLSKIEKQREEVQLQDKDKRMKKK